MGEVKDTQYPWGTFRTWEPEDSEDHDPLFHLPDPAIAQYSVVRYYNMLPPLDAKPEDMIPVNYLYRYRKVIIGPGYRNTGDAFLTNTLPAHVHTVYGWSDVDMPMPEVVKINDGQYLKDEYRRPEWEEEHGQIQ